MVKDHGIQYFFTAPPHNERKEKLNPKRSVFILMLIGIFAFLATGANAATLVEGQVEPVNTLTSETYTADIDGATSLDTGGTDVMIASGTINNNYENGWKLTVTSTRNGKLVRTGVSNGDGTDTPDEIVYTNIKFVKTAGTLGSDLTDPHNSAKDITSGTCAFSTGVIGSSAATTATVDYDFELQITYAADDSLLQGTYDDTIGMTLTVDDD
jgi:hypothetical protein